MLRVMDDAVDRAEDAGESGNGKDCCSDHCENFETDIVHVFPTHMSSFIRPAGTFPKTKELRAPN
jgi:hypothetical protein